MNIIPIAIFHGLGDCINTTSILPYIRQKWPNAHIKWITAQQYLDVAKDNPFINSIETINENPLACDAHIQKLRKIYKNLITPAPYFNYGAAPNGSLLEIIKAVIKQVTNSNITYLKPLLYITQKEIDTANEWVKLNKLNKFVILESVFHSQSSNWDTSCTKKAIEILHKKGYSTVLSHQADSNIKLYNTIGHTVCLDLHYKIIPAIYNLSSGFIGNGSSATCISYSHMCKNTIPHLEFYRGHHWSSNGFEPKKNTTISYDIKKFEVLLNTLTQYLV